MPVLGLPLQIVPIVTDVGARKSTYGVGWEREDGHFTPSFETEARAQNWVKSWHRVLSAVRDLRDPARRGDLKLYKVVRADDGERAKTNGYPRDTMWTADRDGLAQTCDSYRMDGKEPVMLVLSADKLLPGSLQPDPDLISKGLEAYVDELKVDGFPDSFRAENAYEIALSAGAEKWMAALIAFRCVAVGVDIPAAAIAVEEAPPTWSLRP